jgi:hypothetical protein
MKFSHIKTENGDLVATVASCRVDSLENIAYGVSIVSISEKKATTQRGKAIAAGRCMQAADRAYVGQRLVPCEVKWKDYEGPKDGDLDTLGKFMTQHFNKLGVMPLKEIQAKIKMVREFMLGI